MGRWDFNEVSRAYEVDILQSKELLRRRAGPSPKDEPPPPPSPHKVCSEGSRVFRVWGFRVQGLGSRVQG